MATKDTPQCEHYPNPSRRQFLQLAALAGGVALLGGCAASAGSESDADKPGTTYNPIKATKRSDGTIDVPGAGKVAAGKALAFVVPSGAPGIVYADAKGNIKAISALCTHQGCTVRWQGPKKPLLCPCHGSEFKLDGGKVLRGPATVPLPTYKAKRDGDDAIVTL